MNEEQRQMIEDCENRSERLSDWESLFIDDISRLDDLTEKQSAKLGDIWDKVTKDG